MSEKLTLQLHNRQQAHAIIKTQLYPYLSKADAVGGFVRVEVA